MTTEATSEGAHALVERVAAFASSSARLCVRGFAPGEAKARRATYRPRVARMPRECSIEEYDALLRRAHEGAFARDARPKGSVAWASRERRVLYLDSHGSRVDNETLLSTLMVHRTLRADGKVGEGIAYVSGERGPADFEDAGGPEGIGADSAERAVEYWSAKAAPVGRMRVLCDNHLTGLLAHESFGHLTEYDLVASNWSVLAGRQGEILANDKVTIVDAPVVETNTIQGVCVPLDEEGVWGKPVRLLDRGRLANWMHVRGSAAETGDEPRGNARALDFRFPPIVRMRNTYFEPGELDVEEALEELGDGLYLCGGRGGAPHSEGSFMFTAQRGYRVEKGKIIAPVRATSIYGNVFELLHNVEALTSDFKVFATAFGGCGKFAQCFLHVGLGGPHALVSDALVGGEEAQGAPEMVA
jgi:TldD protein